MFTQVFLAVLCALVFAGQTPDLPKWLQAVMVAATVLCVGAEIIEAIQRAEEREKAKKAAQVSFYDGGC